jgi:hypothetical protein
MIHILHVDPVYGGIPLCGRANWGGLTQSPERVDCWECRAIAGLPSRRKKVVNHSNTIQAQRFYSPDDNLHAEPGCYVDGSMSLRACTWKAITVVRAFGACSQATFEEWVHHLEVHAEEDGSETYLALGDEVVNALNEANLSETHSWIWDEGSLVYIANEEMEP